MDWKDSLDNLITEGKQHGVSISEMITDMSCALDGLIDEREEQREADEREERTDG